MANSRPNEAVDGLLLDIAVVVRTQQDLDRFELALTRTGARLGIDINPIYATADPTVGSHSEGQMVIVGGARSSFILWAAAIRAGHSSYVALMDGACPPCKGWWGQARAHINMGHPAFYGPVISGRPASDKQIVSYLVEYSQFNEPLDSPPGEYPGNNLVFERSLLCSEDFKDGEFQKTFFLKRLSQVGQAKPHPVADMSVRYLKSFDLKKYWRRRFAHGRLYGSTSSVSVGGKRFWWAVRCSVLPGVRIYRIWFGLRSDRQLKAAAISRMIHLLRAEFAWSAGEAVGYLFGPASSDVDLD